MKYLDILKGRLLHLSILMGIMIVSVAPVRLSVAAQSSSAPIWVVRSLYPSKYGVRNAKGLAFSPLTNTFLILDENENVASVAMGEENKGIRRFPELQADPLNVAFDPQTGSLFEFNRGRSELVQVKLDGEGLPDASIPLSYFAAHAFGIQDAQGITFNPSTGRMFILDARNSQIVSVTPHPAFGFNAEEAIRSGRLERISLEESRLGSLRGIAYNPKNGHFYVGEAAQEKIYEFTEDGEIASTIDLAALGINDPSALTFAPSGDSTDDPNIYSLFVLDAASPSSELTSASQIVELSMVVPASLPAGTTLLSASLVRTFTTSKTAWDPSSPDPSGIDYWPLTNRFLLVDSEVDEMSNYFTGKNVYDASLAGTLFGTCSTTNTAHTGFTNEPTGVAINTNNNTHVFFSDDDQKSIFEVSFGPDGTYCTADDTLTTLNVSSLYGISDPEDISYGNNTIFIGGGTSAEVYKFNLGNNGVLGGGDDGPMTHFDTYSMGFRDVEAIDYNPAEGTLFITSTQGSDQYLGEVSLTGTLLRAYNLSFMGTASNLRSGITYAPASQNANIKNIYIVSRGIDNDSNSTENDGKAWEIQIADPISTPTPTSTPTSDPTLAADTVGVFRPSNGVIFLKNSNTTGDADIGINYGMGGDYPVTGDWDGNGTDTIGVYRNGVFYLRNSNTVGIADIFFAFGSPGDQPIAGDWNGDGIDTIGVYRSSTFTFYLRNSNSAGAADMIFALGMPGDVGIAGDWTAKGFDTVGVFRPSNGVTFLKNTNATGDADIAIHYGIGGDQPVTGDWDGNGTDTIGVYRGNVFYLRNSNTVGYADIWFALGINGDMPIAGNWDGLP